MNKKNINSYGSQHPSCVGERAGLFSRAAGGAEGEPAEARRKVMELEISRADQ